VNVNAVPLTRVLKDRQKPLEVGILSEDRRSVVAAMDDVQAATGQVDTRWSRHKRESSKSRARFTREKVCVFDFRSKILPRRSSQEQQQLQCNF